MRETLATLLLFCGCVVAEAPEPPGEIEGPILGPPISLPLEIMPDQDGVDFYSAYSEEFTLVARSTVTRAGAAGNVVYLQGHGLGYRDGHVVGGQLVKDGKASVSLNGGDWVPLVNGDPATTGVTVKTPEVLYRGIGGGFRTVRLDIDLGKLCAHGPDPCLTAGNGNRIAFRFNGTDGTSSGYRIIDLDLRDAGGASLLQPSTFGARDNPATWQPPLAAPGDKLEGQRLFHARGTLERPDGRSMIASCADCHAQDGRDLQYFGYSNRSITNRAIYHGLLRQQGLQIASYIRSLPVTTRGRPWNPPYQPGPLLTETAEMWAAGAGLEAVLPAENHAMLDAILPSGSSRAAIVAALESGNLNLRKVPIAIQLPDWNSWLPEVHPLDLWGQEDWSGANATFAAESTFLVGGLVSAVHAADLNGDRRADLVIANRNLGLKVALGNGDGTFAAATQVLAGDAVSAASGDFTGDGKLDLVVIRYNTSPVTLIGNGDGTFAAGVTFTAIPNARFVAVADFNRDGKQDLAFSLTSGNQVQLLFGDGSGAFPVTRTYSAGTNPMNLVAGDLNGDGYPDVAVRNTTPTVRLILSRPSNSDYTVTLLDTVNNLRDVAILQADNDGIPDLLVGSIGAVAVHSGLGGGAFGPAVPRPGLMSAEWFGLGDFNLDGRQDFVGYTLTSPWRVFLNAPGFPQTDEHSTGMSQQDRPAIADFNGDGILDVAFARTGSGLVGVSLGQSATSALGVSASVPGIYQTIRDQLTALRRPAEIPLLPGILGKLDDTVRAFVRAGWRKGVAGQTNWRTIRGAVLDRAVMRGYAYEYAKRNLAQWMGVKSWELVNEFNLEAYGQQVYVALVGGSVVVDGEALEWPLGPHQAVHQIAPHITSENQNNLGIPETYDKCNNACRDQECTEAECVDPNVTRCAILHVADCQLEHGAQNGTKADYDSSAWYHLQMILHAGARSRTVWVNEFSPEDAVHPVDWPYAMEHVDDVARDVGGAGAPWESLRWLATFMKAYQMRNNRQGPRLTGWAMRDISPRLLVSNFRGYDDRLELLDGLDLIQPGLRHEVMNAFLEVFLDVVTDPTCGPCQSWERYDPATNTNNTITWWKVEPTTHVVSSSDVIVLPGGGTIDFPSQGAFVHANQIKRTIDILRGDAQVDQVLVEQLATWAEGMWPANDF